MADHERGYNEEFEEDEVWAALKDAKDGSPKSGASAAAAGALGSPSMIPRTGSRTISRSANANVETSSGRALRQSTPVSIPSWYSSSAALSRSSGCDQGRCVKEDEYDDDEEDDVPPHEFLAKKLARNQISSSSVCEGAGRTLKGRDLRKVRNAVLTKTGFLE